MTRDEIREIRVHSLNVTTAFVVVLGLVMAVAQLAVGEYRRAAHLASQACFAVAIRIAVEVIIPPLERLKDWLAGRARKGGS